MVLLSQDTSDTIEILIYIAGTIWGIRQLYLLGKAFPVRGSMFDLWRSSWPTAEATVTRAKLVRRARPAFGPKYFPDTLYVWFDYEIDGVIYSDVFTAAAGASDRHLENEVVGEKFIIRYNPRNLSDAIPVEKRWHDLKVWWPGVAFGNEASSRTTAP